VVAAAAGALVAAGAAVGAAGAPPQAAKAIDAATNKVAVVRNFFAIGYLLNSSPEKFFLRVMGWHRFLWSHLFLKSLIFLFVTPPFF
jgi:hypothetical protein